MNAHPKNQCSPHEWEDSLDTPGVQACIWCGATREAPVVVEVPSPELAQALRRAA